MVAFDKLEQLPQGHLRDDVFIPSAIIVRLGIGTPVLIRYYCTHTAVLRHIVITGPAQELLQGSKKYRMTSSQRERGARCFHGDR